MSATEYDYIVVGSGAGGGPLAANLAKAGFEVLVLEAGGDPCTEEGDKGRLMYEVPIFHGRSTEYPPCAWNYYVRHYSSVEQQAKDSKAVEDEKLPAGLKGQTLIWYPRAGALGGCTAHNAMITVVPQDSDWNYIAQLTGDTSWGAGNMRKYFARLENCQYVPKPGTLKAVLEDGVEEAAEGVRAFFDHIHDKVRELEGEAAAEEDWRERTHGHGFDGWLKTSEADPLLLLQDFTLAVEVLRAAKAVLRDHIGNPKIGLQARFDPNDSRYSGNSPEGLVFTPLAIDSGKRNGPRDYLLNVVQLLDEKDAKGEKKNKGKLTIQTRALATRVLFDGTRAVGVEYIDRGHVYKADPDAITDHSNLPREQPRARREVILAGGAFNTPQLLMLSGIGPREELDKHGIPVLVDLKGVGQNLQDRYEVGVISEFDRPFELIEGANFSPDKPDKFLDEWNKDRKGVYASNGALVGIIKKSRPELTNPDLYIFGLPSYFKGYYPGYSEKAEELHTKFTWAVLKARTTNTGYVRLASADPWDWPEINFQYFGDGKNEQDPDLDAVVNGVQLAREINTRLKARKVIKREEVPGPGTEDEDKLRQFIRDEAWGHHASCTCPIGDPDRGGVLDSRFRVHGTQGLRVVDASVFPKIPGYFIVTAIYMISEKAFDVIREDAGA